MIVMPSADLDLAAGDVIKSAFGHAGQKCSAASLAILVGPVGHSRRFARQLVDAAASLRVGPPTDPLAEVGPVIEPPHGKLEWALSTLEDDEQWLVEPQAARPSAPEYAGRFWSPGIRTGVRLGLAIPSRGVLRPGPRHHARALARARDRAAERRRLRADGRVSTRRTPTTSPCGSTASRPATSTSTAASPARSCSASRSAAGSARRSAPARRRAGRTTSSASARGAPPRAAPDRRRCTCAASTPASRRSSRRRSRRSTTSRSSGCDARRCRTRSRGIASSAR